MLLGALGVVLADYARFLANPGALWRGPLAHDRSTHYVMAQRLAVDLANADPIGWLRDLDRFRPWPPLNGLLASFPIWVSGIDFRAAVLPALLGLLLTLVLGFLTARRAAPHLGNLAGVVTAGLIAASPAYHRYATDIMLESLGAGLTLLCLYGLLGIFEDERGHNSWTHRDRSARLLAIALTLLLLEKYNYYLLATAGVIAAATSIALLDPERRPWFAHAWTRLRKARLLEHVGGELRRPLGWLFVGLVAMATGVGLFGGGSFELVGLRISITNPWNIVHLAYLALLLRAGVWVYRNGRSRLASESPIVRELVLWHGLPAALWFGLPRRLGYFFPYVSPSHVPPGEPAWLDNLATYGTAFVRDYHAAEPFGLLGAALTAVLVSSAAFRLVTLGPRAVAVGVFALTTASLTLLHPFGDARFLHSWLAAVWIVAGVGAASLADTLGRSGAGRVARGALGGLLVLYLCGGASAWLRSSSTESGSPVLQLAALAFPESPPPELAFVSNSPVEELAEWLYVERGGAREALHLYRPRQLPTEAERRAHFEGWLAGTGAERLLYLAVPRGSPWYSPHRLDYAELASFVAAQQSYQPRKRQPIHGAWLSILERTDAASKR